MPTLWGYRYVITRILLNRWSHYDANAWLRMYDLHLCSHAQLQFFLEQIGAPTRYDSVLDVGSGDGEIALKTLAPLLRSGSVVVTETSEELHKRLRQRGLEAYAIDLSEKPLPVSGKFGLVSLLNVLDRTRCASALLKAASEVLAVKGYLLVATPLPFAPGAPGKLQGKVEGVEYGRLDEKLWGSAAVEFLDLVSDWGPELRPVGLTRLPYISYGDIRQELYFRDDLLVVFKKA